MKTKQPPSRLRLHSSIGVEVLGRCTIDELAFIREVTDRLLYEGKPSEFIKRTLEREVNRREKAGAEPRMVYVPIDHWSGQELRNFVMVLRVIVLKRPGKASHTTAFFAACLDLAIADMSCRFSLLEGEES